MSKEDSNGKSRPIGPIDENLLPLAMDSDDVVLKLDVGDKSGTDPNPITLEAAYELSIRKKPL